MRDQTMDKDRRKFTSGLIRAIEELEVRRVQRSPQQLADAAWQKLQYDFPLVETAELQALLGVIRWVCRASVLRGPIMVTRLDTTKARWDFIVLASGCVLDAPPGRSDSLDIAVFRSHH